MVLLNLTSENKNEVLHHLNGGKPTLVLFYANWCGHCTKFKSEWTKIKHDLVRNPHLNVAQIEHSNYEFIPDHLRINAFPTLQMIRYGRPMASFIGSRDHASVMKFALSSIGETGAVTPKKKPAAPPKKKAAPVRVAPTKKKPVRVVRKKQAPKQ